MRYRSIVLTMILMLACAGLSAQPSDNGAQAPRLPMADYDTPREYVIDRISVQGVEYMDANSFILASGLSFGQRITIPGQEISDAVQRLWDRNYFSDVNIEAIPKEDGKVDLVIYLVERARVSKWLFEGIRNGQKTELTESIQLKPGSELSDYLISTSESAIRKYFADKGFVNASVVTRISTDTTFQNAVKVLFDIDKGSRVRIGAINFHGNDNFPDRKLRRAMTTNHQRSINFLRSSKLNRKELPADLNGVVDYYNARGYRNATIVSDTVYQSDRRSMTLDIRVEEGNKFYFRDISWVGNSVYPTETLSAILNLKRGDLYDRKTLQDRLGLSAESFNDNYTVSAMYENSGYLASQIDPGETVVGTDSIDLQIRIYEGKPFTINEVTFTGNNNINDEVIRRDLDTRPGELYNRALLMTTYRQLAQSGSFEQTVNPVPNRVSDQLVDINWQLDERDNDKVDLSGGWGNGTFIGAVGLELNNLSMRNFFQKKAWRPYPNGQLQQMRLQFQTNGSYYKAASVSFTEPWLGGKKPISLTVGAHFSNETDAYYAWRKATQYFRTTGLYAGVGKRLRWPDRAFQVYAQASFQQYHLNNWKYFILNDGRSNILSFKGVLTRNSTDHFFFPGSGSEFTTGVEFTPPYSLWDGKDYSDPNMKNSDRYRWIEYHKWSLKASWFTAPFRTSKLVLATRIEMGALGSYDKNKVSPFEGYTVGGDGTSGYSMYGVTLVGLRGYANGALTPNTASYARAFNKYTAELRYLILTQESTMMYGMVFGEAGNAFETWRRFDPFQVKRSLGLGIRVFMPIIQMIGVDWAYGFDRVPGETKRSGGHPHFYIGMQF